MVFHIKFLLKTMHNFFDYVKYENHQNASVLHLPQEWCKIKIRYQHNDMALYREILNLLQNDLHFDEIEGASSSNQTLFKCWSNAA